MIFDHLQKTGGTALAKFMAESFVGWKVSPLVLHEDIRFCAHLTNRYDVVAGHMELTPEYDWPPHLYHVTLLREPIDRFLSHYYYVRSSDSASEPFADLARRYDIDELVRLGHRDGKLYIKNFYIRHFLAGLHPTVTANALLNNDSFSIDEVARFVLDRYDFIGMTEQIDLASACLCFQTGMTAARDVPVERVTPDRKTVDQLDSGTLAHLRRLSEADRSFYATLRSAFFRTAGRIISFAGEPGHVRPARQPAVPAEPAGEDRPWCAIEGIDVFCPALPINDRVQSGERCTLSIVLAFSDGAPHPGVDLTIRNHFQQVAYRDSVPVPPVPHDGAQRLEMRWDFICSLGAGTYDCDFSVFDMAEAGDRRRMAHFRSAYQFGVLGPSGASAAGSHWLAPTLQTTAGPGQRAPLTGTIAIADDRIVSAPGEHSTISVTVCNTGDAAWPCSGLNRVVVGIVVVPTGTEATFDDASRHALPHDIQPGASVKVALTMPMPADQGVYSLRVGLVQERIRWFCVDEGAALLTISALPHVSQPGR